MSDNGFKYRCWLIVTWVVFLVYLFFAAASIPELDPGIYVNDELGTTESDKKTDFSPAAATFSIWGIIYSYMVIWMCYATSSVFRRSTEGVQLYKVAPFIHWSVFLTFIINNIAGIAWLLLWDRDFITTALLPIVLLVITNYICTAATVYGIYRNYPILAQNGFLKENRYVLGLASNGFAFYGTWVTLATHLNIAQVLAFNTSMNPAAASAIVIAILVVLLTIWVVLDLVILEKYTRFLFAPYVVLIWGLGGIVARNFDPANPNAIFEFALLVLTVLLMFVKIGFVVQRELKKPAFPKFKEVSTVIVYN